MPRRSKSREDAYRERMECWHRKSREMQARVKPVIENDYFLRKALGQLQLRGSGLSNDEQWQIAEEASDAVNEAMLRKTGQGENVYSLSALMYLWMFKKAVPEN